MNSPRAPITDPYASLLWPDALAASEEEMTAWAQTTGGAQPGRTFENSSFEDLGAIISWEQSSTPHSVQDTNWSSGGTVIGGMPGHGVPLADSTTTDTIPLAPATTPPFPNDNGAQESFFTQFDFSTPLSSTPSLTNNLPSPQSNGAGGGFPIFPTFEAAPSNIVQPPDLSFPQLDITGTFDPNQITCTPHCWFMGDGNFAGQARSGHDPALGLMNTYINLTYPAPLDYTLPNDHLTAPTEALTTVVTRKTVPSSSLGKRSRRSDEEESGRPKKRGWPKAIRVPGGSGVHIKDPSSPYHEDPKLDINASEVAGRGAERLASTTVQGVHHQSRLGPSASQGLVGALEQGQLSRIEEREVETRHDMGSSAPKQVALPSAENAEDGENLHAIPKNLSGREKLMLQMTQADKERGAVRIIKCKLCPKARLSTWETYKRHCKSCEKHPSELRFCQKCGDYFGRPDSEVRHREDKKDQRACLETSQDEASEKKQKVERLLNEFEAKLKRCLETEKEIGPRFSDIVNKMLTNTSKKVSKQEETWSEGNSWATGLC